MNIHQRDPLAPVGGQETPEAVYLDRRKWLRRAAGVGLAGSAVAAGGTAAWWWWLGTDKQVVDEGGFRPDSMQFRDQFPAELDKRFTYGRAETDRDEAARYTNFYEFSSFKWCWRYVDNFQPEPWTVELGGLVQKPVTLDLDQLTQRMGRHITERQYRHRCVERWAMAIPWTGFPLARLLEQVQPLASATHVRFVSFERPQEAPHQADTPHFPWPYQEGLTLAEAMNELTLIGTGMYGAPLLKQHGAPLRVVVPWKYGYKSIKSIQKIELIDYEPATFWSTLNPEAYPFESNVDPRVPRPWDQSQEWMLGSKELFSTQLYNGYGDYVAGLYRTS